MKSASTKQVYFGRMSLVRIFPLLLAIWAGSSQSAEFFYEPASLGYGGGSISIRGKIRDGDFEKFKEFLLANDHLKAFTNRVWLNSLGGNVTEALKFANLFELSSASVVVGPESKCYSACFIMFAGGVNRTLSPFGELGVHRISLARLETDLNKGKSLVVPVAKDVYTYLLDQGMPRALLDKMMETPATSIFIVDAQMLAKNGWYRTVSDQPTFFDTTEKACGKHPDPYPDKSLIEQPRDEPTKQKIGSWVRCKINLQTSNTRSFLEAEYLSLINRQTSSIFPKGTANQARKALSIATQ